MKARQLRANKYFRLMIWILISSHLFWGQVVLAQSFPDNPGSVGLVSNLTGQVSLHHSYQPAIGEPLEFKGPIVYGDRVRTGEHSMLGMLIGNETLVAMQEQTELQLLQDSEKVKVVHLVNGQVCVSTKKNGAPIVIKTPEFSITIEPASMVNVNTTAPPIEGQSPVQETSYQPRLILTKSQNLHMQDSYGQLMANNDLITTVNVLEGSVSLVSNVSEKAQMIVGAEQGVQIIGNTISEPFKNPEVQCRIQDAQQNPQHGKTPKEAQEQIAEDQQRQADNLVAALFESDPAAEFQPILPPSLIVDNGVISTTEFSPPSPGESGFPATPGSPTVIFNSNNLVLDSPFLLATSGSPTVNGPPIIFALQNFSGNISNIPLSSLSNISPFVASDLLAAYGDPQNPDSLLAGIRVQNAAQEQSSILGGIAFRNSTVETSENIAEFTNANVAMGGSILELTDSTLTVSENVVSLQNSTFNASSSPPNSPLVQLNGVSSRMNVAESFLTTNPSTVIVPDGILTLTGGATATIAGSLINLESTTLDATGATNALVRVLGGSSLTVNENGVSANGSEIIVPAGVLSVDASQVETGGDFVALNNSSLSTSEALLTATSSDVTVNGAVVRLSNDSELTIPANTPVVTLTNSALMADALLGVSQPGMVPAGLLSGLVNVNGTSTVNVTGAVVQVTDVGTAGVTLASLTPLLQPIVTNGLNLTGVVLDVDTSTVTVQSDLVGLDNDAFTVSGTGVLAANNATVTVEGAVVAIENGAMFMPNGMPVVTLANSALTAEALLAVSQPGLLSTALLEGLVDADGASTVTLTEAVVQVTDVGAPGVTVASLTPVLEPTITNGLSATGVVLDVDNSLVTIQSDLVGLDNDTFTVPGAGVLAANAAEVTVDGAVVRLSNDSELTIPANTAVVTLANSALTAEALLAVSQPGLLSMALLEGLVDADGASTVTLTEAVVQVTDVGAPGVTVASLTPVLEPVFTNGLSATGVVLDVDNSLVTIQSDLVGLDNDTFTVPGAGVLAANAAEVTVDGAVVRLSNDSELTIPANTAVVTLANSALTAEALLAVSQPGLLSTALLEGLVDADGASTVTLTEAVVQVTDVGAPGVTVASLTPVLEPTITNGLSATGVVLDVDNSLVTIQSDLVGLDNDTFTVPGAGVLAANAAEVTVDGAVVRLSNDSELTIPANTAVAMLANSALTAEALLAVSQPGAVPTALLAGLVDADGPSTVTLTEAVVQIDGTSGVTVASLTPVLQSTFTNGLSATGAVLDVNNSMVMVADSLGLVDGSDVNVSGGLVRLTNLSNLDVGLQLGDVRNASLTLGGMNAGISVDNSELTLNGSAFRLENGSLNVTNGLLDIRNGGTMTVGSGGGGDGDLFLNFGQNTLTSGSTLITLDGGTLNGARISGNPGDISLTVNNGGLLTLTNESNVSFQNGFGLVFRDITTEATLFTVDNSQLDMGFASGGVLARLSESLVVNSGGLLHVNNSGNVSVHTVLNGNGITVSSGTLNGTAVVIDNQSSLNASEGFDLTNSAPATELILTINNGGLLDLQNGSSAEFDTVFLHMTDSSLTANETLIKANNSNLQIENDAFFLSQQNSSAPGTLTVTNGGLLSLTNGSVVNIGGNILEAVNETVNLGDTAVHIEGASTLNNNGNPLINLNNSTLNSAGLLLLSGQKSTPLSPIVSAKNNSTIMSTNALVRVENGSSFVFPGDFTEYITATDSEFGDITAQGGLLSVDNSQVTLSLSNDALPPDGSDFVDLDLVNVSDFGQLLTLSNKGSLIVDDELIDLDSSTISANSTLVKVDDSILTIGDDGLFLERLDEDGVPISDIQSSITVNNGGLFLINNSSSVTTTTGDLVDLRGSTITVNETAVSVESSKMSINNNGFLLEQHGQGIPNQGVGSTLTVNSGGLLSLKDVSTVSVGNSLVDMTASTLTADATLITVDQSVLAISSEVFSVKNGFIPDDGEGFITVSSEVTVNNGGVLSLSNDSRYGGGFDVDDQLLDASSPLVTLVHSSMSTGNGFFHVAGGSSAKFNFDSDLPNDALVSLDASNLMINGSLVGITGANSSVSVVGDLVSLTNGSALTITDGFLVSVLNGGSFSLNGALASFGFGDAGGNTLNITNPSLCAGCTIDNNFVVPILLRPGANTANITITGDNPFPGGGISSNNVNPGNAAVIEYGGNGNINLQLPSIPQ